MLYLVSTTELPHQFHQERLKYYADVLVLINGLLTRYVSLKGKLFFAFVQ